MSYICEVDYILMELLGVGLRRTKTLAWGCDRCDFRVSLQGDTTARWPPRFVERSCGEAGVAPSGAVSTP